MESRKSKIGAHVSGGKDLSGAIGSALKLKLEAIQVFLHGPTTGKMPVVAEGADESFRAKAQQLDLSVFVHGPYLMNFGSEREQVRENSKSMLRSNLKRSRTVGARGVVLHAGSSNSAP